MNCDRAALAMALHLFTVEWNLVESGKLRTANLSLNPRLYKRLSARARLVLARHPTFNEHQLCILIIDFALTCTTTC